MRIVIYVSVLILVTNACHSLPVLEVDFIVPESGMVFLNSTKNSRTDTLEIKDGRFAYHEELERPTPFYMVIDGYNNSRPMNLVLSNEGTIIKFDTVRKVRESNKVAEAYPNHPDFRKDPNKNQVFYDFQNAWVIFTDSIMSLSSS